MIKKNIVHVIYPDEHSSGFVLEGDFSDECILERMFAEWNAGSGQESRLFISSKKRSMSVGDIVCVNGTYYQCKPVGWEKVTTDYVTKLEKDVADHPLRKFYGPWFALNDILRKSS